MLCLCQTTYAQSTVCGSIYRPSVLLGTKRDLSNLPVVFCFVCSSIKKSDRSFLGHKYPDMILSESQRGPLHISGLEVVHSYRTIDNS